MNKNWLKFGVISVVIVGVLGWLAVGIPVCWGVWVTISQAIALFS